MSVRVRFAPSPTGFLHIGGLRTALYNYLFAKKHGGTCVLRIEDTDRTRFVEGAQEGLIEEFKQSGIIFDEGPVQGGALGPYVQSDRFDLYKEHAKKLVDPNLEGNGFAYYAFDTEEDIESMRERQRNAGIAPRYMRGEMNNELTYGPEKTREAIESGVPYVIRLKVPHNRDVRFVDLVHGAIIIAGREIDDQVLIKSDGFPTYHLANVVDDHFMQISHVIRGEEWLPSTPKHVLLYEAFGWEIPQFAHLPLLKNPDGSKMSKRFGDVLVHQFRERGFMPEALINYCAFLGWNPGTEQEFFTMEELIEAFSLERVHKAGAIFDYKRLAWMNAHYLRLEPKERLGEEFASMLEANGVTYASKEYIENVAQLMKERVQTVNELVPFSSYMFKDPIHFEKDYLEQHWNAETETIVTSFLDVLSSIEPFTNEQIEISVKEFLTNNSIPMKKFVHPLRVAITGKKIGADLYSTIQLLGKDAVVRRLKSILELRNQMTEFVTKGIDPKTGETIDVTMVELPITPLEIHN